MSDSITTAGYALDWYLSGPQVVAPIALVVGTVFLVRWGIRDARKISSGQQ